MGLERTVLLAAGLALASGCYSYAPVRVDSLTPGQTVRVRLTPEEAMRLEEMRRTDNRLMEGTYLETSGLQMTVNTQVSRTDPMAGTRALIQTIDVPLSQVVEVEERSFDRVKTGAVVAGLAAGLVWAIIEATGDAVAPGTNPPPPPPPESRIPSFSLFRFALPF